MSSAVPRSVQRESSLEASETLFTPGQRKAVRVAINYCSVVCPQIADLSRLREKVENDQALMKKDRRRLQDVLNKHGAQRLSSSERRINSWAKSDLWDAHRR